MHSFHDQQQQGIPIPMPSSGDDRFVSLHTMPHNGIQQQQQQQQQQGLLHHHHILVTSPVLTDTSLGPVAWKRSAAALELLPTNISNGNSFMTAEGRSRQLSNASSISNSNAHGQGGLVGGGSFNETNEFLHPGTAVSSAFSPIPPSFLQQQQQQFHQQHNLNHNLHLSTSPSVADFLLSTSPTTTGGISPLMIHHPLGLQSPLHHQQQVFSNSNNIRTPTSSSAAAATAAGLLNSPFLGAADVGDLNATLVDGQQLPFLDSMLMDNNSNIQLGSSFGNNNNNNDSLHSGPGNTSTSSSSSSADLDVENWLSEMLVSSSVRTSPSMPANNNNNNNASSTSDNNNNCNSGAQQLLFSNNPISIDHRNSSSSSTSTSSSSSSNPYIQNTPTNTPPPLMPNNSPFMVPIYDFTNGTDVNLLACEALFQIPQPPSSLNHQQQHLDSNTNGNIVNMQQIFQQQKNAADNNKGGEGHNLFINTTDLDTSSRVDEETNSAASRRRRFTFPSQTQRPNLSDLMLEGVGVGGHHFNNGNNLVPSITFSVPSPSSIAVTTAPILGDYLANADINYPSPPTAAGFLTASDLDLINSIDFLDVPPFNNVGGNNDEDGKGVNAPPSSSSATPNTPTLQQHISAIVPPSSPSAAGAPVRRRTTKPRAYSASIYRPSTSSNSSNESNDSTNSSIPVAITSPALHQNVSLTRPFGCPQCPMAFTRKHDLTRHIKTHLGIRDFVCVDCDRSFGRNDALVRHRAGRCTAMHMYNPDVAPLN